MKKLLTILVSFFAISCGVAQNIQPSEFELYRNQAANCWQKGECHNAVSIYLTLAKSGDALSAEKIAEFYESGSCLEQNKEESAKWIEMKSIMEQEGSKLSRENKNRISELAKKCGELILSQHQEMSETKTEANADTAQASSQVLRHLQESINDGGDLIMQGARLNNVGITLDIIGGATAGLFSGIGVANGNANLVVAGGVIGGGLALAGLICNIVGNKRIKAGGTKLRNLEFSGNGMRIKF